MKYSVSTYARDGTTWQQRSAWTQFEIVAGSVSVLTSLPDPAGSSTAPVTSSPAPVVSVAETVAGLLPPTRRMVTRVFENVSIGVKYATPESPEPFTPCMPTASVPSGFSAPPTCPQATTVLSAGDPGLPPRGWR